MPEKSLPSLEDFADGEHLVLVDDDSEEATLAGALDSIEIHGRTLKEEFAVEDPFRRRRIRFRLFREGWAEIETHRKGRNFVRSTADMRYLDPVPSTTRYVPTHLLKVAGALGVLTGLSIVPAIIGWYPLYTVTAAILGFLGTAAVIATALYQSHEKIVFNTLHGRAAAIRLEAGLGAIKRFHAILPNIVEAIADAAESVHDETAVYLRAEMREHYRLRKEGILSVEECATSTERILGEFDGPL